jgi:hypothetical protein
MGHSRLGRLPDTKPWRTVAEHIASGASAALVAGLPVQLLLSLGNAGRDRGRTRSAPRGVVSKPGRLSAELAELPLGACGFGSRGG